MVGWIPTLGPIFIPVLCVLFVLSGCTSTTAEPTLPANTLAAPTSTVTPSPFATPTPALVATLEAIIRDYTATPTPTHVPTPLPSRWDIYDRDPQRPWNRLFRALYGRITADGHEYGRDSLDPLLWEGGSYLVYGPSYQQALEALDAFDSARSETLITDPLKRAMLQRDLWAVFDMLAQDWTGYEAERRDLETRLAPLIQRLALTKAEIESLPDNYDAAVCSHAFAANYQPGSASRDFLPDHILPPGSDWIPVGREGGPVAMTHVETAPFLGRSAFLLFMRVPGGREVTLSFLDQMQNGLKNVPEGTEVALVRRMLLIDRQFNLIPAPLVESIQLRHFVANNAQFFYEFRLDRDRLFAGQSGGIRPVQLDDRENPLFNFPGIDFAQVDAEEVYRRQAVTMSTCAACHVEPPQGIVGVNTILSYSRRRFPLPAGPVQPTLSETTIAQETQATVAWKREQSSWKVLQGMWRK